MFTMPMSSFRVKTLEDLSKYFSFIVIFSNSDSRPEDPPSETVLVSPNVYSVYLIRQSESQIGCLS